MPIDIRLGTEEDLDELERLYDSLNDHLTNYPGRIRGVYPIRETAGSGVLEGCLYVALDKGVIAGSVILRHKPEPAYQKAKWQADLRDEDILVIYTLAVHPDYLSMGIGRGLIDFAVQNACCSNVKALRLDVYENNLPAIRLYEKCGFQYIDTVDLGLSEYGLDWFRLYERLL